MDSVTKKRKGLNKEVDKSFRTLQIIQYTSFRLKVQTGLTHLRSCVWNGVRTALGGPFSASKLFAILFALRFRRTGGYAKKAKLLDHAAIREVMLTYSLQKLRRRQK